MTALNQVTNHLTQQRQPLKLEIRTEDIKYHSIDIKQICQSKTPFGKQKHKLTKIDSGNEVMDINIFISLLRA